MTEGMPEALLTLNCGSSSLKFQLFQLDPALSVRARGKISGIGGAPMFYAHGRTDAVALPRNMTMGASVAYALNWLKTASECQPVAIVHRVVHGGPGFDGCVELCGDRLAYLRTLAPLAPLHQAPSLDAADCLAHAHPGLRQFACFDTAFHAHQDDLAVQFALPEDIRAKGIRRYGFHGLSYAWIASVLQADFPHLYRGRVVVAHLGNGSSLCALKGGRSVDTTMGMTALDGLPMGTRCGAIDPGVILHLQREGGMPPADVEDMLYNRSGLLGLSGISGDVKTLLDSEAPQAVFAIDYLVRKTAQQIAAMAVSLGGIDALIFTGGIGENAGPVREGICAALSWLPPFEMHVIPTNEERMMAQACAAILAADDRQSAHQARNGKENHGQAVWKNNFGDGRGERDR